MPLSIFIVILMLYLPQFSRAVDTDGMYGRMPPWTAVDEYEPCMRTRGDTYCFTSAKLKGSPSDPLYKYLVEYSADNLTHYDRTNIHRGICVKQTCSDFQKISPNLTIALEACLNANTIKEYGLTANVFKVFCEEYKEHIQFDASDFAFGAVLMALLVLNLSGSLYDYCGGREDTIVGKIFLFFAVKRNWQLLVAPPNADPTQSRLESLNGLRVIFAVGCILAHVCVTDNHAIENPDIVEESYNSGYIMAYRVVETLQTSFIMSGLLLSYKVLTSEEQVSWRNLHKAVIWRYLRFTPTYALQLFFIATWMRYLGNGPFWNATMGLEVDDCRRDWWLHILYIHNYVDSSQCMLHSWSMAVDMQMTAVGLGVFFLLKSTKARLAAIVLSVAAGVATPAMATYYNNVHPIMVLSPEATVNWFVHDPTFNYLYKRGHTNLIGYALGWALGYVVFNLRNSDVGAKKYKKYGVLVWLILPSVLAINTIGAVFYDHTVTVPLYACAIYAGLTKLITGLLFSLALFLTIVKADKLRTKLYCWQGWTKLARLSFCLYMVQMTVLRYRSASTHTMYHKSEFKIFQNFLETTFVSCLLSVLLFLTVEAPFARLTRLGLAPAQKKRAD